MINNVVEIRYREIKEFKRIKREHIYDDINGNKRLGRQA
jgi:hypothetical protein